MHFTHAKPSSTRSALLIAVGIVHLLLTWLALRHHETNSRQDGQDQRKMMVFIPRLTPDHPELQRTPEALIWEKASPNKRFRPVATIPAPVQPRDVTVSSELGIEKHILNRDVKALTKALEREWSQEERNLQAAKPPNQLVREYWEKQNHPYKDKWDELSSKIEKAGIARGPQEENYTLDDGSRITKINGICYKAPDPGRSYLGQAEVRRVFCPRN